MGLSRRVPAALAALALASALTGCSDESTGDATPAEPTSSATPVVVAPPSNDPGAAGHTHAAGQGHTSTTPVGDGTKASAGGYRMTAVTLPDSVTTGEVSFRILDKSGAAVRKYVTEQTKQLHLYVVRSDLSGFRHLHPALDNSGTWRARVDLGTPGPWRVIAEFHPQGAKRPIVLGTTVRVAGSWKPTAVPRGPEATDVSDGLVRAIVLGDGFVSDNGMLEIGIADLNDRPVTLGSYLGTAAHLTGFALDGPNKGAFVHMHPYGAPEVLDDGTLLTFHTTFTQPGDYRMFVQFRVDGLMHQIAVTATVS